MGLRFALIAVSIGAAVAATALHAEESRPDAIAVGPVALQIVETASGEKELRHGARVLAKDYSLNPGIAAAFGDTHARVFDLSSGGNACDSWPAIVSVDKNGKVAIDLTMKDMCASFISSADDEGFTFVERAVPDQNGSVWRFTPNDGLKRLGVLVFRPQPNSTWKDLDRSFDHPLSLLDVAPIEAAVRKLTGKQFAELALRLRVASGVEKKGGFLVGTGCQAHACNTDQGFIAVDRNARAVYLAMRRDGRVITWPAAARWPQPLQQELKSWQPS